MPQMTVTQVQFMILRFGKEFEVLIRKKSTVVAETKKKKITKKLVHMYFISISPLSFRVSEFTYGCVFPYWEDE